MKQQQIDVLAGSVYVGRTLEARKPSRWCLERITQNWFWWHSKATIVNSTLLLVAHAGAVGAEQSGLLSWEGFCGLSSVFLPPGCFCLRVEYATAFLQGLPVFLFLKWPIKGIFSSLWTSFQGTTKNGKEVLFAVLFVHKKKKKKTGYNSIGRNYELWFCAQLSNILSLGNTIIPKLYRNILTVQRRCFLDQIYVFFYDGM